MIVDKNEYNLKLEEIERNADSGNTAEAARIADTIDWKRVRNVRTLCMVSEVYEAEDRYEDSKALLLRAYRRTPVGRAILYRLVEVTIHLKQFDEAIEYYSEYCQASPHDNNRYILKYKIYRGRGSSIDEQIDILREYLDQEYNEKYAYELAKLYQQADRIQECLATCDDLVLWFHSGKYVIRALELKRRYAQLTPKQQEIYDHRFDAEDDPSDDGLGAEKQIVGSSERGLAETIVEDTEKSIAREIRLAAGLEREEDRAQEPDSAQTEPAGEPEMVGNTRPNVKAGDTKILPEIGFALYGDAKKDAAPGGDDAEADADAAGAEGDDAAAEAVDAAADEIGGAAGEIADEAAEAAADDITGAAEVAADEIEAAGADAAQDKIGGAAGEIAGAAAKAAADKAAGAADAAVDDLMAAGTDPAEDKAEAGVAGSDEEADTGVTSVRGEAIGSADIEEDSHEEESAEADEADGASEGAGEEDADTKEPADEEKSISDTQDLRNRLARLGGMTAAAAAAARARNEEASRRAQAQRNAAKKDAEQRAAVQRAAEERAARERAEAEKAAAEAAERREAERRAAWEAARAQVKDESGDDADWTDLLHDDIDALTGKAADGAAEAAKAAGAAAEGAAAEAAEAAGVAAEAAEGTAADAAEAAGEAVEGAAEAAGETVEGIAAEAKDAAETAGKAIEGAVEAAEGAAADAAADAAETAGAAVEGAVEAAEGAAAKAAETAEKAVEGAAEAAEETAAKAAETAGKAAETAAEAAEGIAAEAAGTAAELGDDAAEEVAEMSDRAAETAGKLAEDAAAEAAARAARGKKGQDAADGADDEPFDEPVADAKAFDAQLHQYNTQELQTEVIRNMRRIVSGIGGKRDYSDEDEKAADRLIEESKKDQEEARAAREERMRRRLNIPELKKRKAAGQLTIDDVLLSMGESGTTTRGAAAAVAASGEGSKPAPAGVLSALDEALLHMGVEDDEKTEEEKKEKDLPAPEELAAAFDKDEEPDGKQGSDERSDGAEGDKDKDREAILKAKTREMPSGRISDRYARDTAAAIEEAIAGEEKEAEKEAGKEEASEAETGEEMTKAADEKAAGDKTEAGGAEASADDEAWMSGGPDHDEDEGEASEPGAQEGAAEAENAEEGSDAEEAEAGEGEANVSGARLPDRVARMFPGFLGVRNLEGQIADALSQALAKTGDRTSRTGNIVIFGAHGSGKTTLAVGLAKAIAQERGDQYVKMARIYATDLNRKEIASTLAKIAGGILIIEEAGDLQDSVADQLTTAMEFRTDGLIIILEDEQKYLKELLMRHPRFTMKFTSSIHLPAYTTRELVNFGATYAEGQDYAFSEEGREAFAKLLDGMASESTEPVSLTAVMENVEKAIKRVNAFGRKLFSGKSRFDEEGRVLLQAKDFK